MDKPKDDKDLRPEASTVSAETPAEVLTKFSEHLRAKGYSKRTVERMGV